ncbi:unnamed protein product, partial [Closterium sp. NIES-53]
PAKPVEVAVDSSAARGAEPGGAESGGAETGGAEHGRAEPGGVAPEGTVSGGAEPARAASGGALGVSSRQEPLSPQRLREWYSRRCRVAAGAGAAGAGAAGGAGGATGAPGGAGAAGGAAGATGGAGAAGGAAGATGGAGAGAAGGAAGTGDPGAEGTGPPPPPFLRPPPVQSQSQLQPASPLPGPSPFFGPTRGLTERRKPESRPVSPVSRPASPVRTVRAGRVSRPRLPPVPGTHSMTLRPSTAPQRVPLPSPPVSSLPDGPDPESNSLRAASPTVTRFLATAVTDPLFESSAASALVAELVDFAAACRLDYAASPVAESVSASICPPSVGGECALGTDVLEDRQEDLECFAAASPHLVSMLLAPEGDPDALDIPTPRSYAEAIEGPYSSQWQAAMDAEMTSWKSTGTYVDEVPPHGANIVSGMWIFRVKRPPGSPPAFKARYVARGFSQRLGVGFFQTFSPTPKMTTLRGSLHEEIWLRRPPGFTVSFPAGTQWSLRRPVYGLRQAPREWHDTLRTTLAALGFAPSTADPSLFLRTDATLPPFYVLVYVDDLVFATVDTEALAHLKSELQKRHTCTDLAVAFDVWLDDLQLFLQCDSKGGLSLFDLTSGASTAPAADADSTVRSQWLTRDVAARLAVRSHLPPTERAHFSQYKSARTLHDALVARYSSPATSALSRLMLPYLFPDLAAFATVTDLITHLRTSDTRYHAVLPAEFCAQNPPPPHVHHPLLSSHRLPDTLRSVRDHFLSLCPTTLTVDLLEERLLAAETSITAVGASRGDPLGQCCVCS